MAAPRTPADVVRALLRAVPNTDDPMVQATVAAPPTTGVYVNVLLDPADPGSVIPVRRFGFVAAPTAGQVVWLIRAGRTYLCLGPLA